MKFLVHPPNRDSIRLERSGPGGKGKLTVTFPVRKRWVEIPDATCSVYAGAVAAMVDAGTLIVPVHGEAPAAALPTEAPLVFKALAAAEVPVEIVEAEIEPVIDTVSGDAPETSETSGRRSRRRY